MPNQRNSQQTQLLKPTVQTHHKVKRRLFHHSESTRRLAPQFAELLSTHTYHPDRCLPEASLSTHRGSQDTNAKHMMASLFTHYRERHHLQNQLLQRQLRWHMLLLYTRLSRNHIKFPTHQTVTQTQLHQQQSEP